MRDKFSLKNNHLQKRVASRKGIEPLTPGLGNLCSILLSYRDAADAQFSPRAQSGRKRRERARRVSMDFRGAHPPLRRFARRPGAGARAVRRGRDASRAASARRARPAGRRTARVRVADVDDRLDLVLADGRTVRLERRGAARSGARPRSRRRGARIARQPARRPRRRARAPGQSGRTDGDVWSRTSSFPASGRDGRRDTAADDPARRRIRPRRARLRDARLRRRTAAPSRTTRAKPRPRPVGRSAFRGRRRRRTPRRSDDTADGSS